jgi:hypothetical protein
MNSIKQLLFAVALSLAWTVASPQTCVNSNGVTTCTYNIPDDGHAIVPIPFGFPFYGHVFTHSIFFDNGAVSFYSPTMPQRWGPSWPGGLTINQNTPSSFFYSIIPLGTDLIANGGTHTTQGNQDFLRYNWNNVSQFGIWNSRNTFSVEIQPTGFIGINYERIEISGGWVRGIIGNAGLGEFTTFNSTTNFSVNETIAADCSNPLNNVNCPGYQQAFFDQQCSQNALYSPSCPGYATAYFNQQCSISPLYNTSCPGYAAAYLEQQCSLNPLYATTCNGYATAYFNQQCGLDPLYNNQCPGYDDAYYVQQCSLSPLYDSGCDGYAQAYFDQQCSLDGLYDRTCPNFNQAFLASRPAPEEKKEEVVEVKPTENVVVESVATQVAVAEQPVSNVSASPADVSSPVRVVSQPTTEVNNNVTSQSTTSSAVASRPAPATQSENRPATTRQQLAQARLEAQRAKAAEEGASAAQNMDSAASMEQQVEVQNVVLQAMGFNAAFDAYSKVFIPDGTMYKPFTIYDNQRNVDNQRLVRGLTRGSDNLHKEMVDAQYR